jgi:hypothetical protein
VINPIYYTDEYPREGCIAVIDVTAAGYTLAIKAPNGAAIETYANVRSSDDISRMLKEWCEGKAPGLSAV